MRIGNPYPRGADLSLYPTVRVMMEACLLGFYRSYPSEGEMRIGPLPSGVASADELARAMQVDGRSRCHALIVMPRKIVLIRFARRATLKDIERLEYERARIEETPELVSVHHWRIEAKLVHCDIVDGIEAGARDRGIVLKLYRPRWLATHRPRNPQSGFAVRRIHPATLAIYAATIDRNRAEKPRCHQRGAK